MLSREGDRSERVAEMGGGKPRTEDGGRGEEGQKCIEGFEKRGWGGGSTREPKTNKQTKLDDGPYSVACQ